MERSNLVGISSSGESTDEEYVIPLQNNPKINVVALSDQEAKRAEDHWKYLVFDEKKDRSLDAMEKKNSNESTAVITDSVVADEISNMTATNPSHNHSTSNEGEILFDYNSGQESVAGGSQQANKIERCRKSLIFTTKRKISSRKMDNEELDDSGIVLNNSIEKGSAALESDSVFVDKKSNLSTTSLSCDHSTSDEDKISLDNSPKIDSGAAKNLQANEVERRRKLLPSKRKLSSQETKDQLDEFGEKPNKRGKGKYKLRDLPKTNSPVNVNKKVPDAKHGLNKSAKRNTSRADTEDETEDSAIEEETGNYEEWNKGESLSKGQAAHNSKILKFINEGSPAKLKTLNRVGLKTAMMMHQYRKLHGKLKSLRELENMTGWSPKLLETFLSANNITLD